MCTASTIAALAADLASAVVAPLVCACDCIVSGTETLAWDPLTAFFDLALVDLLLLPVEGAGGAVVCPPAPVDDA